MAMLSDGTLSDNDKELDAEEEYRLLILEKYRVQQVDTFHRYLLWAQQHETKQNKPASESSESSAPRFIRPRRSTVTKFPANNAYGEFASSESEEDIKPV